MRILPIFIPVMLLAACASQPPVSLEGVDLKLAPKHDGYEYRQNAHRC